MTMYEMRRAWLLYRLETYRETQPEARRDMDRLIKISRQATGTSPEEKRLHNLLVLRYFTDKQLSVQRICAALHIGRGKENYETITGHAIDRLMVLAYGIDGIQWAGEGRKYG